MICFICRKKITICITKDETVYCLDCGKTFMTTEPSETTEKSDNFELFLTKTAKDVQFFLRTFDEEILAELTESEWSSNTIVEHCMDRVLEKLFPSLCLDDVSYELHDKVLEVTLPRYWQTKAKESEEILEYVTCSIDWKRS